MPSNTTTDQPTLAVTQADREAAAEMWERHAGKRFEWHREIRRGQRDDHFSVQAFARHRTHSEPRPVAGLREAFLTGFDVATKLLDDSIALGDPRWPEVRNFAADKFATISPDPTSLEDGEGKMQHVAYFDEGAFHWMSGIKPRDCELYAAADPSTQGV